MKFVTDLFGLLRAVSERLRERIKSPPHPWLQLVISTLALATGTVGATFAGLGHFKIAKARATIVVDHFDDKQGQMPFPGQGQKNMHQMRMWITNTGQSAARIRNVAVSPYSSNSLMTAEQETARMNSVLENRTAIGTTLTNTEVAPGQKAYYSSSSFWPDEAWEQFVSGKQLVYIFALVTFSDEQSGNQDVMTQVCVRLEPTLGSWNYCASGHNQTLRP